jgi:hypothetical protein
MLTIANPAMSTMHPAVNMSLTGFFIFLSLIAMQTYNIIHLFQKREGKEKKRTKVHSAAKYAPILTGQKRALK